MGLLGAAVWLAAAVFQLVGPGRPSVLWELPAGYRGWVVARRNDPACPPLVPSGTQYVIVVPPTGQTCTADASVFAAFRPHRFQYVHRDGTRAELPRGGAADSVAIRAQSDGRSITHGATADRALFFVGTRDDLLAAPRPVVAP